MDVLLIEDEQKIADFVIAGFAAANISTHHELDGFRGLNTALIKTFDAIVLDVGLPLLDGFQVIQEYRKKEFSTPVIMLTARTELDDRLKVFQSGADDYLPRTHSHSDAKRVHAFGMLDALTWSNFFSPTNSQAFLGHRV